MARTSWQADVQQVIRNDSSPAVRSWRVESRSRTGWCCRCSCKGTSNGPTEAVNGRLEHLPATVLGHRNLPNYIARALAREIGGF